MTLCGDRACRVLKRVVKRSFWRFGGSFVRDAVFGDLALHFWRKCRTKRWFWRLGAALLDEVSYETLGASLNWRQSRMRRWLWRLGASLLEEVSYEALVLETWRFTFSFTNLKNTPVRSPKVGLFLFLNYRPFKPLLNYQHGRFGG